jgi:tetratricopeptide (TPR) repeat protein
VGREGQKSGGYKFNEKKRRKKMTHPEVEEIARFAEGNADKAEHDRFIAHIAQCEKCRKVYSATLKFVEKERKQKKFPHLLHFPKIEIQRFFHSFPTLLTNKLGPAIAALILILIIVPLLFNIFSSQSINNKTHKFIRENNIELKPVGFDAINSQTISAIRAGFFVEDLYKILEISDKKELQKTIGLLKHELEIIFKKSSSQFFTDPANIGMDDLKKVIKAMNSLENKRLYNVFQFGRFVEKTIFNCFKKERAVPGEVDKYLRIAEENLLHQDAIEKLKKVNHITDPKEYKETWISIRNIFNYIDYMKKESEDYPMAKRADIVFKRVKNAADKAGARHIRLSIINARIKLYAIALPNGRIVINPETLYICYSGVETMKGDCRLAFIMGHELAHQAKNDFFHRKIFLTWDQYGSTHSLFSKNNEEYSRKELEADKLGALYATMAGYDIRSLFTEQDNFLAHWESQIGKENIHRETHDYPSLEKRVAAVCETLRKVAEKAELFRIGVLLLQMGNFRDAEKAFTEFIKYYKAREVYNNIGACSLNSAQYLLTQNFSSEYLRFRLAIAIDYSTSAEPDRGEGNEKEREMIREYLEKAIDNFKKAAHRDKIDKLCRYNLSAALILMEKYAEAKEVCDSILDRAPRDVNALNNKAIAVYYSNEKDPQANREAIDLLEKAYKWGPEKFEVLYNLGSLKKTGRGYWETYLKLPTIPRDEFYNHVYREVNRKYPLPLKTSGAPKLPDGIDDISMDFAAVEEKWGKENTIEFNTDDLRINVLVKDNIRVVALQGKVFIVEEELLTAEKYEKFFESFGPPQRVVRHNSGNFYVYEKMGFSISEVNDKVMSYIWFQE